MTTFFSKEMKLKEGYNPCPHLLQMDLFYIKVPTKVKRKLFYTP
jgi:hypothetical protein